MTTDSVIEIIIIPVMGWVLIAVNGMGRKIARIEAKLDYLSDPYKKSRHKNDED